MTTQLVSLQYNDQISVDFTNDVWFNATAVAKNFGKLPNEWLRLESTQDYIQKLTNFLLRENPAIKNDEFSLLKTQRGRHNSGTWFHPKLAVAFARWLDTDFAIWCDMQIEKLLHPKPYGLVDLAPVTKTQYGILSAIVSEIATSSGKEGTTKVALWSRFSNHFNLGSAKDLPAIKFDEAKAYLENLKAEYERGFTLAVVKKDDLLALGYDSETKMFAVKVLPAPVQKQLPVTSIPDDMVMISAKRFIELENFSISNDYYFRQLPPKRTNVKEMLECLDVGMNLITDALDDLVLERKNIDRAVDKILKGLLAMRRYQPKHMQADYCG